VQEQKVVANPQLLRMKYEILESLHSGANIVTHCYGMKNALDPTNVQVILLLEYVVKIERLIYQQWQNLQLSFWNF
jgi:hypothetical protein